LFPKQSWTFRFSSYDIPSSIYHSMIPSLFIALTAYHQQRCIKTIMTRFQSRQYYTPCIKVHISVHYQTGSCKGLNSYKKNYINCRNKAHRHIKIKTCTPWWQGARIATGQPRDQSSISSRIKNFHFSMSSRLALGPTQPPIQWLPGTLSPEVKLTTHLQIEPRTRKGGSIHPLLHMSSWCSA
jgi:hypothetical protein